ncbi:MAG: SUMF1/EgtB/PvdO family nonheme iron enzyme, partial [Verrucomicrobiota bacterium]
DWFRMNMNDAEVQEHLRKNGKGDGGGRTFRVLRGGSWYYHGEFGYRSSSRYITSPTTRDPKRGFRMVLEVVSDHPEGSRPGESMRNGLGMTLRWCPPGEFWMGSPSDEDGREDYEIRHQVALSRGFWMGQHEVTQSEWGAVMGRNLRDQARLMRFDDTEYKIDGKMKILRDYNGTVIGKEASELPIYFMNWTEAADFCRKLTERERRSGKLSSDWEYRLPTEAQWEYACRAGTDTALYTGGLTIKGEMNGPELDAVAWYGGNSSEGYEWRGWNTESWTEKQYPGGFAGSRKVGQKAANPWGLQDMIGNVWEWCGDWADGYSEGFVSDPGGPSSGSSRIFRGGSWLSHARANRAAHRSWGHPSVRHIYLGFRVSLNAVDRDTPAPPAAAKPPIEGNNAGQTKDGSIQYGNKSLIAGKFMRFITEDGFWFQLCAAKTFRPDGPYPLVLFLHDGSNEDWLEDGAQSFSGAASSDKHPCFVVAFRCSSNVSCEGWEGDSVASLVRNLIDSLPVDRNRVYLTSLGGSGGWHQIINHRELFAGALLLNNSGNISDVSGFKDFPIWQFHCDQDADARIENARAIASAMADAGAPHYQFRELEREKPMVYRTVFEDRAVLEWLFAQRRRGE